MLQWARENGCPWDESTCWGAAENGHLEVLEWAKANGCGDPDSDFDSDPDYSDFSQSEEAEEGE